MNPSLVTRAIRRHRYMQDAPAYREFLEYVRDQGDVWLAPQAEVARWWERRQAARLRWSLDGGSLSLETELAGGCVELDRGVLHVLPHRIPWSDPADGTPQTPVFDAKLDGPFFRELIGHLGYAHLEPATAIGPDAALSQARIAPVVAEIHETAQLHQRFPEDGLERLRAAIEDAHREAGLPSFRLWTLPMLGDGPARVALSSRYDVDKAIVNMPAIQDLEESFGLRSTVYLRPLGMFYGVREIRRYLDRVREHEIALHGEFISTAEERFGNEFAAAKGEKDHLERMCGRAVEGVCMHGGELRTNTSPRTRDAIEQAGYRYETMYRNRYYLPLHLPEGDGVRTTLSIGQHFADISVPGTEDFVPRLRDAFVDRLGEARVVGGVFVPVMHPLYFDLGHYLRQPMSLVRIAAFAPRFLGRVARMRSGQFYSNETS